MNNPEFKAIHSNNVKVKKMKKMKSIMKLVGKLVRIFVGIARKNESYSAKKVQPLSELAADRVLAYSQDFKYVRSTRFIKQKGTDPSG